MTPQRIAIALDTPPSQLRATSQSPRGIRERLLFAGNFLRQPHMLGSIVPSSRFLVERVLEPVDWQAARVVVEYGPGVGTLTRGILKRMHRDARLVVIETNAGFCRFLRANLPDPRFDVVQDSAANVRSILQGLGLAQAHCIISGIPIGSMPEAVRVDIAEKSRDALGVDGLFVVYQFTSRALPALRRTFSQVDCSFERRNLPPAKLFVCR